MAHKNPDQLLMLVDSLKHPESDVYVHIDKKVSIDSFSKLCGDKNIIFIKNRLLCNWGGNSFLNAIASSLHEILNTGQNYDFINLLSGQDYPLRSSNDIHIFLSKQLEVNFISYDDITISDWWKQANARYEKYHFTDSTFKGKYILQRILNTITPRRKFPLPMKLYGGSNSTWWTISGKCAKYLENELTNNLKLRHFLRYTWSPDEFIIASLIMNSEFRDHTINDNLRYIDWSEQKAHPKILTLEDLDLLKKSNMLFARKFDITTSSEILEKLHNRRKESTI